MGTILAVPVAVILTLLSLKPSDFVFWLKWIYCYIYIEISRRNAKKRFDLYDMTANNDPEKLNFITPKEEYMFESPLPESHVSIATDEVFFYGINSKSECLVVQITRECNEKAQAWLYLKLKNGKIYQLKEMSGYQQSSSERKVFTFGGLQMHYLTPMRTWRIFFNGLLREGSKENPAAENMVHVKFALLWIASSDVFDFTSDVSATTLAAGLARANWNQLTPPLERVYKGVDFYSQSGIIMGDISIDGNIDEHIYLFGEKTRYLGDTSFMQNAEYFQILGQITKNGTFIHYGETSIPNVVEKLTYGYIVQPDTIMQSIKEELLSKHLSDENKDTDIRARFRAGEMTYDLKGWVEAHLRNKEGWDGQLTFHCVDLELNSLKGCGVVFKGKITQPPKQKVSTIPRYQLPVDMPFAVNFSEEICQEASMSGGKGSSLGKLMHLSKVFQEFTVPNGIIVSTSAYKQFITKATLKEIRHLENVLYGNESGDAKTACQSVMDEIVQSEVPLQVQQAIEKNLQNVFGEEMHSLKFAVRSSATGEDTEQLSAAGQMETFLGITGLNEIMLAVKKCWASQFGYVPVQYKRQNGQVLNSPMAVVIQEMVSCDVAGVLFTCDPLTGNPTLMSITANYGLGESVVSGSEEPDTIELGRDADDKLVIQNKTIGAKSHRIVMAGEGTSVVDVSENDKRACCLSDEMALLLGNVAIKIEKSYRSHRDIEWGIWKNHLYIFQSRPVTSGTGETDFEIDHELDAPLRAEIDYFTVSNVGEALPGAMSPIGIQFFLRGFRICFQKQWPGGINPKRFPKSLTTMYNHLMLCAVDMFHRAVDGKSALAPTMIAMFGRIIDDDELIEAAVEKYKNVKKEPVSFFKNYRFYKMLLSTNNDMVRRAVDNFGDYRIPVEKYKTSQELYSCILRSCSDIYEPMMCHNICSSTSTVRNMVIMSLLQTARGGEMTADVYRDFSQLLSTIGEVESADIPSAMQSLAYHIASNINPESFKSMDTEEATQWLETTSSVAGIKYREFLEKHGHRCLREFDLRSTPWRANPQSLVKLLQNLVGTVSKDSEKKKDDFNKVISDLNLQLGVKARFMLRLLLPRCRQAVQNRETSKSLVIKGFDAWRKGFCHLAKVMVSEGRIPDEDLLFFMTLEEIRDLLSSRSPKIIAKANHRRRRHSVLDNYIFPEIMKGFPIPINMGNTPVVYSDENFTMKGIPVSRGVARGFVRVAMTLEEASHLKPGEILLTYSTDIGWSPYFPTLAGVVTELGGLISHGAVVSREYGLPCIAGLHGATRKFQTGDYVLLDGNKGILQKLSVPEKP